MDKNPDEREEEPASAQADTRRAPLPWQRPKPAEDDPESLRRVQAILANPNYRVADRDMDFLQRDELRGMRLEIDFMKPDVLLDQHKIASTVVVFGSARICEPAEAHRKVDELRAALAAHPNDENLTRRLAVAERVLANSRYYDVAREFGRLVGEASQGRDGDRLVIMTGGGPGLMEAANRGAIDAGAQSVGLNISLPHEQFPNPYITPDLCFTFHYFALRKLHLLLRTKALVAFPGGYGTFDELFEVLTLVQTRKIEPMPVVLVGEAYWRQAVNFDFLVDEGVIEPEDRELFRYAETAQEIWDGILNWYAARGNPAQCWNTPQLCP